VQEGWLPTLQHADPIRSLDFKFCNTAKALKKWSQKFIGSIRLQLALGKEVILKLDQAQDQRALSPEEALFTEGAQGQVPRVRNVIFGSPDRETDLIRALIRGACRVWQWAPSRTAPQ
jgi:hypothetical protein